MNKYIIFFENGDYLTIKADSIKEEDGILVLTKRGQMSDFYVAKFQLNKISGYVFSEDYLVK